jgi:hypothetical protein
MWKEAVAAKSVVIPRYMLEGMRKIPKKKPIQPVYRRRLSLRPPIHTQFGLPFGLHS